LLSLARQVLILSGRVVLPRVEVRHDRCGVKEIDLFDNLRMRCGLFYGFRSERLGGGVRAAIRGPSEVTTHSEGRGKETRKKRERRFLSNRDPTINKCVRRRCGCGSVRSPFKCLVEDCENSCPTKMTPGRWSVEGLALCFHPHASQYARWFNFLGSKLHHLGLTSFASMLESL
jgi:hypothetical protein